MIDPIVNIAVNAARTAGNIIIRSLERLDSIRVTEKKPNDYVTDIDQQVEREIIYALFRKAHPNHGILGEESGELPGNEFTWIIDPIDGTRNFIHGFPQFAVSIGISEKGKIKHGVIYDPVRQELFTATRGKGARLNDRRIRVSKHSKLEECLLGTGFPYRHSEELINAYTSSLREINPPFGRYPPRRGCDIGFSLCSCRSPRCILGTRLKNLGPRRWNVDDKRSWRIGLRYGWHG